MKRDHLDGDDGWLNNAKIECRWPEKENFGPCGGASVPRRITVSSKGGTASVAARGTRLPPRPASPASPAPHAAPRIYITVFLGTGTTAQYCSAVIPQALKFPAGDTLVSVRLRDDRGNLSPVSQLFVRVGN